MMTVVMDRTLLAPRPAPPAPRTPDRATLPYRRIVYGVLVGALTMLAVATLDTFAGATVPVLGTFAALPGAAGPAAVVEVPAPPRSPGTCLNWTRPDAADTEVVDCAPDPPVRAGGLGPARRPAHAARRPAVAPARQRAVRPDRHRLPGAASSTPTAGTGSARSSRRPRSGARATASCAAACSALAVGRALPDERQGRRAGPVRGARSPAPASAIDGRSDRRPGRLRRAARGGDGRRRRPRAEVRRRRSPPSTTRTRTCSRRARRIATEYAGGDEVIADEEAHRLLGQPHRGLLEGGHPQGQLQPGRAAARPQRVRAGHRVGQRRGVGGRPAPPRPRPDSPSAGCRRAAVDRPPEQQPPPAPSPPRAAVPRVAARRPQPDEATTATPHRRARLAPAAPVPLAVRSDARPAPSGY